MAKEVLTELSSFLESFAEKIQTISAKTYVPHEAQTVFHKSEAKEKQFIGGNRSGKTVSSVLECIFRLTKTHPYRPELNAISGPIRGRLVCVSFTEGLQEIILPLFKQWLPSEYLINRDWDDSYSAERKKLTLANGSTLTFMTYEQKTEKFAGTSLHFTAFDEEPPEIIWQECIMRLLDTDGDWWIAMTPVEGSTWTYTKIFEPYQKGERPYTLVVTANTTDNPYINQEAFDRTFANFDGDDASARAAGEYNFNSNLIYKSFNKNSHVLPGSWRPDRNWRVYTSLDSGWRHPAAWLWIAVHESGRIIVFHEIVVSEKTVASLAKDVLKFEQENGVQVYNRTGDPALLQTKEHTGTSIKQEYAKHGIYINVDSVPRGPGSVDNGINKVTTYLDARVRVRASDGVIDTFSMLMMTEEGCPKLIGEFEKYQWKKHSSRKIAYEKAPLKEPEKKNDDAIDALRYFVTLQDDLTPDKLELLAKTTYYIDGEPAPTEFLEYAGMHHVEIYEESESAWW